MLGSDIAFGLLPMFRAERNKMAQYLSQTVVVNGSFTPQNHSLWNGTENGGVWTFQPYFNDTQAISQFHYVMDGCYRDQSISWVFQQLPWWSNFLLVPLFMVCQCVSNGQKFSRWIISIQVLIGCAGYAGE